MPFGWFNKDEALDTSNMQSWVLKANKVRANNLVSFLRGLPVQGSEYLLVLDGDVKQRYNQNTDLNMLQVLTGNYIVYRIDVKQRHHQFTLDSLPLAEPGKTISVNVDLTLRVEDATTLFKANIGEIEPEVQRRIERVIRHEAIGHLLNEYQKLQHILQQKIPLQTFNFGIAIEDALITVTVPQDMMNEVIAGPSLGTDRRAETFRATDVEFDMQVEFYGQKYPYDVTVRFGVELDYNDPQAAEKLKQRGISDPGQAVRQRVEPMVRRVLGSNKTDNFQDAEQTAIREIRNLDTGFGVRISYADVRVMTPEGQKEILARQEFQEELLELLQRGWHAVVAKMTAFPEFKEQVQDFISTLREQQRLDDKRTFLLEDRTFEKLEKSIEIGIVDPEVPESDVEQTLRQYLLAGSTQEARMDNNKRGMQQHRLMGGTGNISRLTSGQNDAASSPPANDASTDREHEADARYDYNNVTEPKPDKPSVWFDDDEAEDDDDTDY